MHNTPEFFNPMKRILGVAQLRWSDVKILSPSNVYAERDVDVGEGTLLYPNIYLIGNTRIGKNCVIYAGTYIVNSTIGDNCIIGPNADIKESTVRNNVTIAHAEVNRSYIGPRTNIKHTCYVGDAKILRDCNIGAGVVFCNYDGNKKSGTVVREKVFIGSGAMLIAPLTLGAECFVAAGSVITKDVPPHALVLGQGPDYTIRKDYVTHDKDGWHLGKSTKKKKPR